MQDQKKQFRSLMGRFVTGVTIVATPSPEGVAAMTANAVTAVSLEPLLLLVCIRNESRLLPTLLGSGGFSVNVLAAGQDAIGLHYGGRALERSPARWTTDASGLPQLHGANACFFCRVDGSHRAGDHTVVYGEVTAMQAAEPVGPALVYAAGRFADLALPA
jgi:flavin reductase (DIM6/NTAB) family NADH-FMN oxidoreductase RutF